LFENKLEAEIADARMGQTRNGYENLLNGNQFEYNIQNGRSRWSRGLRRRSVVTGFLGLRVRIPPKAWMSVPCECCVSPGSLYDQPIPRSEES